MAGLYQTNNEESILTELAKAKDDEAFSESVAEENAAILRNYIKSFNEMPQPEPVGWLIPDLIVEDFINLLHGDGGAGKSYFSLYLAFSIALGKPVLGRVIEKGKVLYVDFELNDRSQWWRAHDIARGFGLEAPPADLRYIAAHLIDETMNLEEITKALRIIVKEEDIKLVILDSYGFAVESDPEAARDVMPALKLIEKLGTVLVLDHQSKLKPGQKGKDKDAFGSVYKGNRSRNRWQIQTLDNTEDTTTVVLHHKKNNFGPLRESIGLTFHFDNKAFSVEQTELDLEQAAEVSVECEIMTYLKDTEATAEEIADATQNNINTIKNRITRLKKSGKVIDTGERSGKAHVYCVPASLSYSSGTRDDTEAECEEPSELVLDL